MSKDTRYITEVVPGPYKVRCSSYSITFFFFFFIFLNKLWLSEGKKNNSLVLHSVIKCSVVSISPLLRLAALMILFFLCVICPYLYFIIFSWVFFWKSVQVFVFVLVLGQFSGTGSLFAYGMHFFSGAFFDGLAMWRPY